MRIVVRLLPGFMMLAAILGGYLVGPKLNSVDCGLVARCMLLVGSASIFIGLCRTLLPPLDSKRDAVWGLALLLFTAVLGATDPFTLCARDEQRVIEGIAFSSPFIVGGVFYLHFKAWLEAIGCWLIFFSAVLLLAHNVTHYGVSGAGFFRWIVF